jgi:hypothetical protein
MLKKMYAFRAIEPRRYPAPIALPKTIKAPQNFRYLNAGDIPEYDAMVQKGIENALKYFFEHGRSFI